MRLAGLGPALLLALAACGSRPAPADPDAAIAREESAPVSAPAKPASPDSGVKASAAAAGVRRCGWLSNPTPGNWWLTDSQGQWILSTQGGEPAPGMDGLPDMSTAGWAETNGRYGHGCACMTIAADSEGRVTRVSDAAPKPLKQCEADRNLPRPE